jgi:hypothetical protein
MLFEDFFAWREHTRRREFVTLLGSAVAINFRCLRRADPQGG